MSKEQVLEIVKSNRWNIQSFNGLPLYLTCAATLSGWRVKEELGVGYKHFFYLFSKGRAHMYYDESDWRAIADAYFSKLATDDELHGMIKRSAERYEQSWQAATYLKTDLSTFSDETLVDLARKLCACITDAVGTGHAIEGITFGGEERLKAALEKRGDFSAMDFSTLCSPVYPSFLLDAQATLLRIKTLVGEERDRAIHAFIDAFGWTEATYQGAKKFTRAEVSTRADELHASTAIDVALLRRDKEALMSRLAFTTEERFIVKTIEESFKWQDDRKMRILKSITALDPVVDELARRFKVDSLALKFILPAEITLENLSSSAFCAELDLRKEKSAYYVVPDGATIFTGEDYAYLSRELHMSFADDISSVIGMVASRGITRGIVRVCESISSIDRVQLGEILIASMTRPEYLPAMQRAAAFITDEGGITCHAAIVAREMGKPCIIGTKFATKVLKDGDMVEVDADKGIVRKI